MQGLRNHFVCVIVICGSCSSRNAILIENLIGCISDTPEAEYVFDEKQYFKQRSGIWMCSPAIRKSFPFFRDPIYIILMDIKGTIDEFSTDKDVQSIFELGVLLSSVFVFNFGENFDEEIFQKLLPLTHYANNSVKFTDPEYYHNRILSDSKEASCPTQRKAFQNIVVAHRMRYTGQNNVYFKLRDFLNINPQHTKDAKAVRELVLAHSSKVFHEYYQYMYDYDNGNMYFRASGELTSIDEAKLVCGVPVSQQCFSDFVEIMVEIHNGCAATPIECQKVLEYKTLMIRLCHDNFLEFIKGLLNKEFEEKMPSTRTGFVDINLETIRLSIFECFDQFQRDVWAYAKTPFCSNDPLDLHYDNIPLTDGYVTQID